MQIFWWLSMLHPHTEVKFKQSMLKKVQGTAFLWGKKMKVQKNKDVALNQWTIDSIKKQVVIWAVTIDSLKVTHLYPELD